MTVAAALTSYKLADSWGGGGGGGKGKHGKSNVRRHFAPGHKETEKIEKRT